MNARSHVFEISVEGRQIEEVVSAVFHTLLLHRTLGKFHFKQQESYSVGSVGMVDVDSDFLDLTYVRVESDELEASVRKEVSAFRDALRTSDGNSSGQISLEFYQKKRSAWPFNPECTPWEVWSLKLEVVTFANEHERQVAREQLHDVLADKIMFIAEAMNRHEYVPKMPAGNEQECVFDCSFADVQPYLHKITFITSEPSVSSSNVLPALKKYLPRM